MNFFYCTCICFFVIVVLVALIFLRAYLHPLHKLPGPPLIDPIFGSISDFVLRDCCVFDFFKNVLRPKYGGVRKNYVFFGGIRLDVADPVWLKHILVTNAKNYRRGDFAAVEHIFMVVGESGLVVVNGENHKRLRKLVTPAFKPSNLKKIMPHIELCGERLVSSMMKRLEAANGIAEFAVRETLNKTTLDVIGLVTFGYDFRESCTLEREDTLGNDMNEWLNFKINLSSLVPFQKAINYAIMRYVRYLPKCFFKNYHTGNKVHDLVEQMVESKMADRKNGWIDVSNNSRTLLDFILDGGEAAQLTRQELHDTLMTFVVAGHETSSVSITWTLFLLSKHQDVQEKCRREAMKLFSPGAETSVDWDDVKKKLTYINAVVHESLRMFPPVPFLNRANLQDDEIAGYHIPANTDILLVMCDMHRNPEYWPHPDEFMPERFLESEENIRYEAFMPFGDGVHKCIGYQLALTEICYLIAKLVSKFEFNIDANVEYRERAMVTMRPQPELVLSYKTVN